MPANSVDAYLIIHDLTGREMFRVALESGANKKLIEGNVLQKGIYIYHIECNGAIQLTKKLVKMK